MGNDNQPYIMHGVLKRMSRLHAFFQLLSVLPVCGLSRDQSFLPITFVDIVDHFDHVQGIAIDNAGKVVNMLSDSLMMLLGINPHQRYDIACFQITQG